MAKRRRSSSAEDGREGALNYQVAFQVNSIAAASLSKQACP